MAETLSKNQIDQLGTRLRAGTLSESDLRAVDEYRRGSTTAYESVVTTIRLQLHLEPTGRPAKSTSSLKEKLKALETEIGSADALVAQVSHRPYAERYDTQLKDLQQKLSMSRTQLVERKPLVDAMFKNVITELDRLGEHPVDLSN